MTSRRRVRTDERGATTIEMVVLLPLLFGLVVLGVQAALFYYACALALGAAQDGARAASAQPLTTAANTGRASAVSALEQSHGGLEGYEARVDYTPTGPRVTVTGQCLALAPGIHLHVERSAVLPWERLS